MTTICYSLVVCDQVDARGAVLTGSCSFSTLVKVNVTVDTFPTSLWVEEYLTIRLINVSMFTKKPILDFVS